MGGAVSTSRDFSTINTTSLKAGYTSQINRNHQLKTGFEFVYDDLNMEFGLLNYFLPEGNTWTVIEENPYRLSVYVQDKMEYEGFIASMGLNAELIDPNTDWYDVERYDNAFYSSNYSLELDSSFHP